MSPDLSSIHRVTLNKSLSMPESPLPFAEKVVGGDAPEHFLLSKSNHLLCKDLVGPLPPHVAASGTRVPPSPYRDGR